MKNFTILGFTERSDFWGGLEKPIYRGGLPKKGRGGGLNSLLIWGGLGKKEGGGVFEGGG